MNRQNKLTMRKREPKERREQGKSIAELYQDRVRGLISGQRHL